MLRLEHDFAQSHPLFSNRAVFYTPGAVLLEYYHWFTSPIRKPGYYFINAISETFEVLLLENADVIEFYETLFVRFEDFIPLHDPIHEDCKLLEESLDQFNKESSNYDIILGLDNKLYSTKIIGGSKSV